MKVKTSLFEHLAGMSASAVSGAFLLVLLLFVDKLEGSISKSFLVIEWSKITLIYTIPLLALKTNIIYVEDIKGQGGIISLRQVLATLATLIYLFCIPSVDESQRVFIEILLVSKLIDIFIEEKYLLLAASGKVLEGYLFSLIGNISRLIVILSLILYINNEILALCIILGVIVFYSSQIRIREILLLNKPIIVSLLAVIITTYMSAYMVNVLRLNLDTFDPILADDFAVFLSLGGIFGIVYNVAWQRSYFRGNIVIKNLLKEILLLSILLLLSSVIFGPFILRQFFAMKSDNITIIYILAILILFAIGHVLLNLYKIRQKVVLELISYIIVSLFAHVFLMYDYGFIKVLFFTSLILFVLGIISAIYEKSRLYIYEKRI